MDRGGWQFFGKLRAQGDFVRLHAPSPLLPGLSRFLEDANEALHRAAAKLSPAPIGFYFREASDDVALVGALGPGEDKVGRSFPLAVFRQVPARELAAQFPLLPALHRDVLLSLETLFAEIVDLPVAVLLERLRGLPSPGPGEAASAAAWAMAAAKEQAAPFLAKAFGGPAAGQRYYGLRTFALACDQVRGGFPGGVGVALDCPGSGGAGTWAWLALAQRQLPWASPPPFFWREGASPALLLCLGAPPPSALLALATPSKQGQKIWPLTTQQPAAIAQARAALSPQRRAALDSQDLSIDQLVAAFAT